MHLYCYTRIEMNGSFQLVMELKIGGNTHELIEISKKY